MGFLRLQRRMPSSRLGMMNLRKEFLPQKSSQADSQQDLKFLNYNCCLLLFLQYSVRYCWLFCNDKLCDRLRLALAGPKLRRPNLSVLGWQTL